MSWKAEVDHTLIREVITEIRSELVKDFERQLDKYGLYKNDFLDYSELSHLSTDEIATRQRLDRALLNEAAGYQKFQDWDGEQEKHEPADESPLSAVRAEYSRAYDNYIFESAKIATVRLIGQLVLEYRGLIENPLLLELDSSERQYFMSSLDEIAGEVSRDTSQRISKAIDLQYRERAVELPFVFGRNQYTILTPDLTVLRDVLTELHRLNQGEISHFDIDELFGWVYQYFGEDRRDALANRVNNEGHKLAGGELATSTQKFTPRYIVEWLVDNSLGRIWYETTNSEIEELSIGGTVPGSTCDYLAPHEAGLIDRSETAPEEVTLLDPACGGGHMLLYAFEVLWEWYEETYPSWSDDEIAISILQSNLYGIELDPGAARLATLALYVKAKTRAQDPTITRINIYATSSIEFTDAQVEAIREQAYQEWGVETDLADRVIRTFHTLNSRGSLVQPRSLIEELLENDEIVELLSSGEQTQLDRSTDTDANEPESGQQITNEAALRDRLFDQLRDILSEALETDGVDSLFGNGIDASVELLEVLADSYDVVVTNPPYVVSNKMDEELKQWLKDTFSGSRDIYAAFIERNLTFAEPEGYVAMITMETFMFQYSFRGFRPYLLEHARFVDAVHLRNRDDGYMDVSFILTPRASADEPVGRSQFIRIVDTPEPAENKQEALTEQVVEIRSANGDESLPTEVSRVNQDRFKTVPRTRFLYWFGDEILELIEDTATLDTTAELKVGLQTGDDERFLRDWWEVPQSERPDYEIDSVGAGEISHVSSESLQYRWFTQSGDRNVFLDPTTKLVQWGTNGDPIREADTDAYIRNEEFYGRPGVTFRLFGSYLMARHQPVGHFFGHSAHFVQSERQPEEDSMRLLEDDVLLAYLNSSLARFIVDGFNPGLRYEVGDVKNLPAFENETDEPVSEELAELAQAAVDAQAGRFRLEETRPVFDAQYFLEHISDYNLLQDQVDALIARITALIDARVFEQFDVSQTTQDRILGNGDLPPSVLGLPAESSIHEYGIESLLSEEELIDSPLAEERERQIVSRFDSIEETNVVEAAVNISEESDRKVGPETVARIRSDYALYTTEELTDRATNFLSFCVGVAFGRWEVPSTEYDISEELQSDLDEIRRYGFAPITEPGENYPGLSDVIDQLLEELGPQVDLDFDDIEPHLKDSIEDWLAERFFKQHHCKEYRRRGERTPIYIQLGDTSPESGIYLYYHAIDRNTLSQLERMIEVRIEELERRRESLEEGDSDMANEITRIDESLKTLEPLRAGIRKATPEFDHQWTEGIHTLLEFLDTYNLLAFPKEEL